MILEGSSRLELGLITSLRIRGICEGSPEARLLRLLRRKKFDEAEKFAKMNRLSLEEVHQVCCRLLEFEGLLLMTERTTNAHKVL